MLGCRLPLYFGSISLIGHLRPNDFFAVSLGGVRLLVFLFLWDYSWRGFWTNFSFGVFLRLLM